MQEMERRIRAGKHIDTHSGNPNENKSTSLPYIFEADGITIHVSQGSIVDVEGVDTIVNTAWSVMEDTVGIASIISDRAGKEMIEEYRKYVIVHGPLKEGETLVTTAGNLPYKGVIHCVVPRSWSSASEKDKYVTKLNETILNIFLAAETHGFFKIAMPAMRADSTASTDLSIYAEVYLKSINDYSKQSPTHLITDVHFVDTNTVVLLSIRTACEKYKTISSFLSEADRTKATGLCLQASQERTSQDTSRQVPSLFVSADSRPLGARVQDANRTPPHRQASLDQSSLVRDLEIGSGQMARQLRSMSVSDKISFSSMMGQQESMTHSSRIIQGHPIQETFSSETEFPCYKMDARPRGICLIISNREFHNNPHGAQGEGLSSRDGTEIDSEKLADIFGRLDFIVMIKENVKDYEMTRELMDVAGTDHTKYDCFVCCILSHGAQGKVFGSNGIPVEIGQLTSLVQSNMCPTLGGKPKVFFIQACQGLQTDEGSEIEADAMGDKGRRPLISKERDFLLGYATVPGYISYRVPGKGSWYIDKLVDMLNKYHHRMDLLSILTKVNDEVSKMEDVYEGMRVKQMPKKESTLCKRLFFK